MRTTRVLAVLCTVVMVAAIAAAAGFFVWQRGTVETARWVVSDVRDGQRALTVGWATNFEYCAQRPSLEVVEKGAEVRIQAEYRMKRGVRCGLMQARRFDPVVVHLSRPLAGRRLVGEDQADVPVSWYYSSANQFPEMPSVVGMNAAAARRALSRARYPDTALPSTDAVGFVTRQSPAPGTILNRSGSRPAGRPPEFRFSSQDRP